MSFEDDNKPGRGAYTPPTDDDLPFRRNSYDPRSGRNVGSGGGKAPPVTLIISAVVLLLLYWPLCLLPYPGGAADLTQPGASLIAYADRLVLGVHTFVKSPLGYDPEGLLGTLPAIAHLPLREIHASCSMPQAEGAAIASFGFGPPVRRVTSETAVREMTAALRLL